MKVFLQSIICHRNAKYIIKKLRINKYRLFLICFNFTNLIRLYYITIDLIIRKKRQFPRICKLETWSIEISCLHFKDYFKKLSTR